jgi:two-component system, NtrC family, sensor histidine kinase HydH
MDIYYPVPSLKGENMDNKYPPAFHLRSLPQIERPTRWYPARSIPEFHRLAPDLLQKTMMETATPHSRIWASASPWIFIGAVGILLPLFAYMTYQTIDRQKKNAAYLLLEKGAALIRSFEAGTRTGIMGTHWDTFQLQRLLTETAQQPDIVYLMVTDMHGRIVAHDDPSQIGKIHETGMDLQRIVQSDSVSGRQVLLPGGDKVFEVTSRFMPSGMPMGMRWGHDKFVQRFQSILENLHIPPSDEWVIFIGLDMGAIEDATQQDIRQTIIMGAVLLLIGFGGIVFLFLAQGYRSARASLSRIKAFSDNLVEHMPIGLVALDHGRVIAMMNQAAGGILRLPVAQATGKPGSQCLPQELMDQIKPLSEQDRLLDRQVSCRLRDGRVVPVEVNATRLYDENGTSFGSVLLLKDMSEVESLRKEIARTQRLATVGRLAAGVAHEIRNPLSSIKGFATYFKERYADIVEDQQIAGIMIQEVDKLNRVVGQLLEFARPVEIQKKWTPLRPLIEDALKLMEHRAKELNIDTHFEASSDIHQLYVDPDRINQVLLNLFINAAEAMTEGGKLTVSVEKATDDGQVYIYVCDTGPGISEENLIHIFDPYFTTKPTGTGLGLAIVHKIIEAHQGIIRVYSGPQGGTHIRIRLPLPEMPTDEAALEGGSAKGHPIQEERR